MSTKADWCAVIERCLPPVEQWTERNRAITAAYAGWYRQQPWLFKWAGMAAIASDQVGIGLAAAEMLLAPHQALSEATLDDPLRDLVSRGIRLILAAPVMLHDEATAQLRANLQVIKRANDAIFADTGWAHLAYIHGGLDTLESCMAAESERPVLEAFRMIDEAAQLLSNPATFTQGWQLVDQAAVALLRHEQMTVLPPYMEQMSDLGRLLASLGTWMDFTGAPGSFQPSFSRYFGLPAVLSGKRSIANTSDRWQWIESDLLPAWFTLSAAYEEGNSLDRRMTALAAGQAPPLHQIASALSALYRGLAVPV